MDYLRRFSKYTGLFLAIVALVGFSPRSSQAALNVPYPTGVPRCFFYEPKGGFYDFMRYPQLSDYKGTVSDDVTGHDGDPIPVTNHTLKWMAVMDSTEKAYTYNVLSEADGYTAELSSNASGQGQIQPINNANVNLVGTYPTKLGATDIRYTLTLKKDGARVASCSVDAHLSVRFIPPYVAPTPADVKFPAETNYSIATSKGTSTAAFKFTSPIKDITFYQNNLSTYLGNNFKNIFWIGNRYGGGPAGRWNISDPWNPQEPEVLGMIYGGSPLALGRPQPAAHRGPFSGGLWPHPPSLAYGEGVFGDLPSGEARFTFSSGEESRKDEGNRGLVPIVSLAPGRGLSWGQVIDEKWQSSFNALAMDTSSAGRFFLFTAGGNDGYGYKATKNPLSIFNLTSLTGSVAYDSPALTPVSSQPWMDVDELTVVEVPGVSNHFLLARVSDKVGSNPLFYVGEIDAASGNIIRQNSFNLPIKGTPYSAPYSPLTQPPAGSNLEFATVNGKSYLFMTESFTRNGIGDQSYGTLKIAGYQFDPVEMKFIPKGSLSFKNFPTTFSLRKDAWNLARTADGSAYPLLMVAEVMKNRSFVDSYNRTITVPHAFDANFYSLKEFIDSTAAVDLAPSAPDIKIPGEIVRTPLTLGMIIPGNLESTFERNVYHVFLKKEGGKTNLYMYRQNYLFDGRQAGDPVMPYHEHPTTGTETHWNVTSNNLGSSFRGQAALRIDKVDVSGFTGGVFTSTNPNNPTNPTNPNNPGGGGSGATVPLPPPPPSNNECFNQYRNLCDQIQSLRQRLCALLPSSSYCQ